MPEDLDQELAAMNSILGALQSLDDEARSRVLKYVFNRLKLEQPETATQLDPRERVSSEENSVDSFSPVGMKWLRRNGISFDSVSSLFSSDGKPELIAQRIPGDNVKQRLRNVALLLGAAEYLGTGEPRFSDAVLRETSKQYGAYDGSNHTAYLKSISSEVSGSKESGFSLTARGLVAAAQLLKTGSSE